MVHGHRPYSKTPMQLAYTCVGSPEPLTVVSMGKLVAPFTKEFQEKAFPLKNLYGNAQLTLINDHPITDDYLFDLSLKLNAWKYVNEDTQI